MPSSTHAPVRRNVVGLTLLLSLAAATGYAYVIAGGSGMNWIELASLPLFTLLFSWITFSFLLASLGWRSLHRRRGQALATATAATATATATISDDPDDPGGEVGNLGAAKALVDAEATEAKAATAADGRPRTAVLMPVYNESPDRVFAGIRAMLGSLQAAGDIDGFDFYVLSDTTDHEVWLEEEHAWAELTQAQPDARVFYRHRPKNVARKAGNIADFCVRWGSHYPYMIVLDADSLLTGQTMIELVRRMDADARLGILQVPPVPIGRHSLFARMQQFSAAAYSPVFVEGFAIWAGSEGNYWGHNAILRVEPFLEHCDLPILPGKAPLGGEILSHDFVEAALMLRHGWKVELATDLGGSYEECPPGLAEYAQRDQRWCQGNLQHSRLLVSENFHPLSRFHFASGVMAYVASPIWIAFTGLCVLGTLFGSNVKWSAQQRDDRGGVRWSDAAKSFGSMTALGVAAALALALAWLDPQMLIWFSPIRVGLIVSIPMAVAMAMGSVAVGRALERGGLLLIPEETSPPDISLRQIDALRRSAADDLIERPTWFESVIRDPAFHALHVHIQESTDADVAMPAHQSKAIEAALATGGPLRIPVEVRMALLADVATLRALHLESQLAPA